MANASRPRRLPRLRRILALATDNWPARGYLAVFAASVAVMFLFPDSGIAASPMLLTAPLSLLSIAVPFGPGTQGSWPIEALAVGYWAVWLLLCALVNAAVIGALATRTAPGAAGPGPRSLPLPRPQGIRGLLTPAFDNWLARGYLAVVAAAVGSFLYFSYLAPDPGFAAIWPLIVTAPLSILALLGSVAVSPDWDSSYAWLSPLVFSTGAALSGLVNAALLGHLAKMLRTPEPRPAA
ncbi:SCO4225 family membrane protein [Streptomyces sp. NPDC002156]